MKKIQILAVALAMALLLTGCRRAEFGLSENTGKRMTITADRAVKESFFMSGSLEADEGERIEITSALANGSIRVEILGASEAQSMNALPAMDGEAVLTADLRNSDVVSGTVPAGSYMLKATCLEKATGTVRIEVKAAEQPIQQQGEQPAEPGRLDGERFETVIILEGMEETVHYEHVRNAALGFEMDYDYESFVRRSEADRDCFVSVWDNAQNPENYLEVTYSADSAEAVAASVRAALSQEYELLENTRELEHAGNCLRIEAAVLKGTNNMADQLQAVYIIPTADGCRVAAAHYAVEAAEGFGRRFNYLLNTLTVIDRQAERRLTDEQALSAVRNYCYAQNPGLEEIVNAGEQPVYWDVSSSSDTEIVVVFRSYTGAQNRYYVNPISGETYVTELVPGIIDEEQRTGETLNVWNYLQ